MTGFVGLGNMGAQLAANLLERGHEVVAHDLAGAQRCPAGAEFAACLDEVARRAEVVVLSLPDGTASEEVSRGLLGVRDRRLRHVVDTSTIGPAAARAVDALLREAAVGYVDAPVSGGVAGARARTLAVMYAGDDEVLAAVEPVLCALSDRRYRVGDRPGMAQALKLANNFLSATALVATSEAVAFALAEGLGMATVLEVLNASSGQSAASSDKFVNHVLPGRYASGFANTLMAKDVRLYLRSAAERGAATQVGELTSQVWDRFAAQQPDADFTQIYPFVAGAPQESQ